MNPNQQEERGRAVRLGIAGAPDEPEATVAICARLGVRPVFLLGPADIPHDTVRPSQIISLGDWEPDTIVAAARGAALDALWIPVGPGCPAATEAARRLHLPHLPCPTGAQQAATPIEGARVFDIPDLDRLGERDRGTLPLPAWVRLTCANGDGSCIRLEHIGDLSLATAKLRKRNGGGPLRIQPVVEGPIYRLLAFKTGRELLPLDLVAEEMTSSVYRVPLGMSMPVPGRNALMEDAMAVARRANMHLPAGWGYVEFEFAETGGKLRPIDIQCPARPDRLLRRLVLLSRGVDMLAAALECALGRTPCLEASRDTGVAMRWLVTRSGVVTEIAGLDKVRAMPGVETVQINAREGDVLCHVVDAATRSRGGYIMTTAPTAAEARQSLDAAWEALRIFTSPALA